MTTTTHRIPGNQALWDSLRKAGGAHLLARVAYIRMAMIYGADTDASMAAGQAAELGVLEDRIAENSAAELDAIYALAKAEAAHIMGL